MPIEMAVQEMSGAEFETALKRIDKIIADVQVHAKEVMDLLARMSKPQVDTFKARYRHIWRCDQINRMRLAGLGEIPTWVGERQRFLKASEIARLPESALKVLADPTNEVELLTENKGVRIRPIGDLNPVELRQVVDPRSGILRAEKQRIQISPKKAQEMTVQPKDIEDSDSVVLGDDRKHVVIVGRHISLRVALKTLRSILGR